MKKISFVLAVVMLMSLVLTSCGSDYKAYHTDENYVSTRENNPNRTVNGVDGVRVTVPKNIKQVVCFSPEAAIIMSEVGVGVLVTAVDEKTADVLSKPVIEMSNVVSRQPDVVFITEDYDTSVLEDANVPFFTIPTEMSLNDIKSLIKIIEKIFNVSTDSSLTTKIDASQNVAQQDTQGMVNKYPTFIDLGGFDTAGKGTYVNEIISVCGGENIFADREGYFTVSKQDIIDANPAFIFTTSTAAYRDSAFADVDAVKNGRVYSLPTNDEINIHYGTHRIAGIIDIIHERIMEVRESK